MKIGALLLTATTLAAIGCAPPPPPPVAPAPPPPPAPAAAPAPPPPPAAATKLVGLPLNGSEIQVLGDIEFDTNQATIRNTPQTQMVLNTVLAAGKRYTMITKVRVEGHTDSDGNEANNQSLSERRAAAVVKWLVDRGIDPKRFHSVGCGSKDPIASNSTPEGKQKNRRTEFDIEEVDGQALEGATAPCAPNPFRPKH